MVTVLRQTGAIPILLETRDGKLGRLLDQTPLCHPPYEKRPTILTPNIVLDALRASTKRMPATSGKGLEKITEGITRAAVAA